MTPTLPYTRARERERGRGREGKGEGGGGGEGAQDKCVTNSHCPIRYDKLIRIKLLSYSKIKRTKTCTVLIGRGTPLLVSNLQ